MSTVIWTGNGQDIAQVDSLTPANVGLADIFKAIINTKTEQGTAATADVAGACLALYTALTNSILKEFQEIEWTNTSSLIKGTAKVPGMPFTLTASTTDGNASNTQTLTRASVTANASSNDWNNPLNWSTGAVPVDADDVVFDGAVSNVPVYFGLDQTGIDLASLTIRNKYKGPIGLPKYNANGYEEYRGTELILSTCTLLDIRSSELTGLKISTGSNACTINLYATGQSQDGLGTVQWRGNHASNEINMFGGSLGIARLAGQVAQATVVQRGGDIVASKSGFTNLDHTKDGGTYARY